MCINNVFKIACPYYAQRRFQVRILELIILDASGYYARISHGEKKCKDIRLT